MTEGQPLAPGHDQIVVAATDGHTVCHAREHARPGVLAEPPRGRAAGPGVPGRAGPVC